MKKTVCAVFPFFFYHNVWLIRSELFQSKLFLQCSPTVSSDLTEVSFSISVYSPQLIPSYKASPSLYELHLHHLLLHQLGTVNVSAQQAAISCM